MFTVVSGLFLEVASDEILVVGGDFREGDARSLVGDVVDSLTLAIDVGQVFAKAKGQTQNYSLRGCGRRHLDEAAPPADSNDLSLRGPSTLVNNYLQVGGIAKKPAFLRELLFHGAQ